jgi:SAM-dependent methyltransferase
MENYTNPVSQGTSLKTTETFTKRYRGLERKFFNESLCAGETIPQIDFQWLRKKLGRVYLSNFIEKLICKFNLNGARVLEIGGSNLPYALIDELGVKHWVSLDSPYWLGKSDPHKDVPVPIYEAKNFRMDTVNEKYIILNGLSDDINETFYNQFDFVFSCACFEHVLNIDYTLDSIYKALVAGGIFYTHFGPIWSCAYGHHIWHPEIGLTFGNSKLPPFVHLLCSFPEVYEIMQNEYPDRKDIMALVNEVKNLGYNLNHLFCEDYGYLLKKSPFAKDDFVFYPHPGKKPDVLMQKLLQSKYPGYSRFDVSGITIFAQKKFTEQNSEFA